MKELDGRKLDHKTLTELRIRAVKQVEAGESPEVVIKTLGFTRCIIYRWLSKYREGGIDALKAKRLFGRPSKLTGRQLKWIYETVVEKNPMQLKFQFALWNRWMIKVLVQETFQVNLSEVSVGRLLRKLGLSPQRPLMRAYQQDKEKVQKWLEEEYPGIKKLAKAADAEIYFGDESHVRSDYHSGTTWAPVGNTPVIETTGARYSINMLSAISAKGSMRFMVTKDKVNSDTFIEFLKRLIHNAERPIFLIVDGHPVHHSKKVREHVASTSGKLQLFFLPPYSPELNPDELVWNDVKNHGIGKQIIVGPDDFKEKVSFFLRSLQKLPRIIRSFFMHPKLQYAA
jgi:transposase